MDVEAGIRKELIEQLGPDFICFELVKVEHVIFQNKLEVDVVAIPVDADFHDVTLGFECKRPAEEIDFSRWCEHIKQATDYVYSRILPTSSNNWISGRRLSACFLYPAPPYVRGQKGQILGGDIERSLLLTGAFHLATHSRVGYFERYSKPNSGIKSSRIMMGPHELWVSGAGWRGTARGILAGKRRIGSSKIDVLPKLDGLAAGLDAPSAPWE